MRPDTPNLAFNQTAQKLCFGVPSTLRAPIKEMGALLDFALRHGFLLFHVGGTDSISA